MKKIVGDFLVKTVLVVVEKSILDTTVTTVRTVTTVTSVATII